MLIQKKLQELQSTSKSKHPLMQIQALAEKLWRKENQNISSYQSLYYAFLEFYKKMVPIMLISSTRKTTKQSKLNMHKHFLKSYTENKLVSLVKQEKKICNKQKQQNPRVPNTKLYLEKYCALNHQISQKYHQSNEKRMQMLFNSS